MYWTSWGFYPDETDKEGRYNRPISEAKEAIDCGCRGVDRSKVESILNSEYRVSF